MGHAGGKIDFLKGFSSYWHVYQHDGTIIIRHVVMKVNKLHSDNYIPC